MITVMIRVAFANITDIASIELLTDLPHTAGISVSFS